MVKYYSWQLHAAHVFKNYRQNKKELAKIVEGMATRRSGDAQLSRATDVPDPTPGTAINLENSARYVELRKEVAAVDTVLHSLPFKVRQLINRVYIDNRCSLEGGAAYFGISYHTARNWKKETFLQFARQMGWIE